MKSEHRHDLETNELAAKLAHWIEKVKPYASTAATAALVVLAVIAGGMYMQKSAKARRADAWDAYHLAVQEPTLDLDGLKQAAEQNAGTNMAQWTDITWADGQVHRATRLYILNRDMANEHLVKAEGVFQRTLSSGADATLVGRAHFGLGRIYEMRSELEKAREQYLAVSGSFSKLAAARAEDLQREDAIEDYAWLAKAKSPLGVGLPGLGAAGKTPAFEADTLDSLSEDEDGPLLGDMLENFGRDDSEGEDRYDKMEGEEAASAEPSDESAEATSDGDATESSDSSETPVVETPAVETP